MAFHGRFSDALIGLGKYDLSGISNEGSFGQQVAALDSTTFGKSSKCYLPGLSEGVFNGAFLWDTSSPAIANALKDFRGVDAGNSSVLTFANAASLGSWGYITRACMAQIQHGGPNDDLLRGTLQAHASDLIVDAKVGEMGRTARTASGNGSEVELGAVSSTQSLYATLHLVSITADSGTPTLDVEVESDTTGFPSATSRIAFAQLTATGSEWKSVAGAITDTYYRVKWTIGGGATNPSCLFIVAFGIA